MMRFLVESYAPASLPPEQIEQRARRAAAELSRRGTPVAYVQSIFVPQDETSFHLIEAPSAAAVATLAQRAGIPAQRVVEAIP